MALRGTHKLPYDPAVALAHLSVKDPVLGRLIDKVELTGGFTLKLTSTGTLLHVAAAVNPLPAAPRQSG